MKSAVSDLQQTFLRAAAMAEFGPRVLSRDPWLLVFDSFMSDDESNAAFDAAPADLFQASADDRYRDGHRSSSSAPCITRPECAESPAVRLLEKRASAILNIPIEHADLQFVRYSVGDYYRTHHDQNSLRDEPSGVRALTLFVYLSDQADGAAGGETRFPELGLSVAPRKGRAVLWSNVLADAPDLTDARLFHEGAPVASGTKRGANLWFYPFPFRTFWRAGCTASHDQFLHPHHLNALPWLAEENILVHNGTFAGYGPSHKSTTKYLGDESS